MKRMCLTVALVLCVGALVFNILPAPVTVAEEATLTESGGYLYGVPERTTLAAFRTVYTRSGYSVFDANNNALAEDSVLGTGCKVCYESNDVGETVELILVIAGDVDGNGKVTTTDYVSIKNHLVNNCLEAAAKLAADVDGYGVSTSDYMKVKLHFDGLYDLYSGVIIEGGDTSDSTSESEAESEPWTSGWA